MASIFLVSVFLSPSCAAQRRRNDSKLRDYLFEDLNSPAFSISVMFVIERCSIVERYLRRLELLSVCQSTKELMCCASYI